ncbi:glycerate kinase, partial [Leifsonia williamsii]|uniref:glycerate kinase n=1 Tax=Leifsonia williamsii TaxID=3035919 RepID=UPI003F4DD08F
MVIAPDSFKGTASATEVATALADGWRDARPADEAVLAPMADGGEGTLDAFLAAVPGASRRPVRVTGPAGAPVDAAWVLLPDGTAVVELAATSGLGLLARDGSERLLPLDAHTLGFGQAIGAALDAGAERLVLAIGGSSSTDGGTGALTALGARFLNAAGEPVPLGGRGLRDIAEVDLSGVRALPPGGATILSDVTSPLLGPLGAATVFGPQKGAGPAEIEKLEAGLAALLTVVGRPDSPGAGAAGGTGYGLLAWGAELASGASAVGSVIGLPALIADANVVITGEGRFDSQSAAGKVPTYVAELARAAGASPLLVAGSLAADPDGFAAAVALDRLAGG